MPHIGLLTMNVVAIAVGVAVIADPPPTWLSVGWAAMHVLILGRIVAEACLNSGRTTESPAPAAAIPSPRTAPVLESAGGLQ
jgi:cellulose synthase (UDP-forming)